jgi:hypothetical protein
MFTHSYNETYRFGIAENLGAYIFKLLEGVDFYTYSGLVWVEVPNANGKCRSGIRN